ncbi:unnamed protein product [Chrysoparadoxa australica]
MRGSTSQSLRSAPVRALAHICLALLHTAVCIMPTDLLAVSREQNLTSWLWDSGGLGHLITPHHLPYSFPHSQSRLPPSSIGEEMECLVGENARGERPSDPPAGLSLPSPSTVARTQGPRTQGQASNSKSNSNAPRSVRVGINAAWLPTAHLQFLQLCTTPGSAAGRVGCSLSHPNTPKHFTFAQRAWHSMAI